MSEIQLLRGDCLERMEGIASASADLILADPPYGTTDCKWDSVIPLKRLWSAIDRIAKPNAAIIMTAAQPFTTSLIASNMKQFRYTWLWDKKAVTGFANAKKQPPRHIEDIVVFYDRPPVYNPQGLVYAPKARKNIATVGGATLKGEHASRGGGQLRTAGVERVQEHTNYPRQLLTFGRDKSRLHPTQKPVALMEYLIRTYSREGELVLDFSMGSGTTGIAAINARRQFVGIERDATIFETARNRLAAHDKELLWREHKNGWDGFWSEF